MKELVEIQRSSLFENLPFLSPPHHFNPSLIMLLKCVGTCLNLRTLSVPEVRVYFQTVLKELYKLILHILRICKMYPIVPI